MTPREPTVKSVWLPEQSIIGNIYKQVDLSDAYAISLPAGTSHDPHVLARFVFSRRARWMDALMGVRDAVVSVFGLKTSAKLGQADDAPSGERISIFRVYQVDAHEIILGEDDSHLDFRLSLLCLPAHETGGSYLVLSTVVHCHNALGRAYLRIIAPFHRLIVPAMLRRAARSGWPHASEVATPPE